MAAFNGDPRFEVYKQKLFVEAWKGNLVMVKALAKKNPNLLNSAEEDGCNILHYAAVYGGQNVVEWLLSDEGRAAGFSSVLSRGEEKNLTALHFANLGKGDLDCFTAIVEGCKVENGEREKMLNAVTNEGETVLHLAAKHGHTSIIEWLLSKGRELGFAGIFAKTNIEEATALHIAVKKGNLEACKAIVEGCKVENGEREQLLNAVEEDGRTAFHFAAYHGRAPIVSWFLSEKPGGGRAMGFNNVLGLSRYDRTVLHYAAEKGNLETCKAIVKGCKVEKGEREQMLNAAVYPHRDTVLHLAVRRGNSDIVSWLLSHDADEGRANGLKSETITAGTIFSETAFHNAAESRYVETLRALLSGCTVGERLKMFLAVESWTWTSLHLAARSRRPAIIRELLLYHPEMKMIVDHRDYRGMTALHRVILDGGVDEESKEEWTVGVNPEDPPREEVVAALLTYEYDNDEEERQGHIASSFDKSKKIQQQQQQQQAAFIDVNLGLKIEKK